MCAGLAAPWKGAQWQSLSSRPAPLEQLPRDALSRVINLLQDPAGLAATCRTAAALLNEDAQLLSWADTWASRLAGGSSLLTHHRRPGYDLLHWLRLRCIPAPRLVALLLAWVARQAPEDTAACAAAQQLLDTGNVLGALQALLPHSEHLLLPYLAQAGQTQLLQQLLQQLTAAPRVEFMEPRWGEHKAPVHFVLASAAHAAARDGHLDAMQLLVGALERWGDASEARGLLEVAVRGIGSSSSGSSSAACVVALAQRGNQHSIDVTAEGDVLLPLTAAAELGSATAVAALLGLGMFGRLQAYGAALRCGQLHLLPLLRPAAMSDAEAAMCVCSACRDSGDMGSGSINAGLLALLPDAAQLLWETAAADGRWWIDSEEEQRVSAALCALLMDSRSMPTLHATWAAFTEPTYRSALAVRIFDTMTFWRQQGQSQPCLEAVQWAVQHALPCIIGEHDRVVRCWEAAMAALGRGDMAAYEALGAPAAMAAEASSHMRWLIAQRACNMITAVRSGDIAALRAEVVAAVGAQYTVTMLQRMLWRAMAAAADVADRAVAVAMVEVLAPHLAFQTRASWNSVGIMRAISLAHGDALLRALCEQSAPARALAVGPHASWRLCHVALEQGCVDAAEWLVRHPGQRQGYLTCLGTHSSDPQYCKRSMFTAAVVASLTALLQRLSAPSGSNGDATAASPRASSKASAVADGLQDSSAGREPPAGARQLSSAFVERVLSLGYPDLVHALLVYMDSWRMSCVGV